MSKKDKKSLPAGYNPKQEYSLDEAAALIGELSTSKFVGSVDIDIILNVPEKMKQDRVAGSVVFPHQVGDSKTVAVITEGEDQSVAKKAGADQVGFEDLVKKIEEGNIDFDVLIATPSVMPKIAKLGRVLGPRNMMPNPKNDTVTTDLEAAIKSFKAGKTNFKMSDQFAIRCRVGKTDMKPQQLSENIQALLTALKPEVKKLGVQPIKKITLSPTMGKGVRLNVAELLAE